MRKKILFFSNFSLANTGFGKYQKNILTRLYKTGKYEICELAAGVSDADVNVNRVPWRVIGVLPKSNEEAVRFNSGDENLKRAYSYGLFRFDEALFDFKPDIVICHEDIWSWSGWVKNSKAWGKFVPVCFHPLDAEPLSEEFIDFLKDFKNIYTYGKWSKSIAAKQGLTQVKVAPLGVDNNTFRPLEKSYIKSIRDKFGIKDTDYVVLMVARNQIRKKFDALFESINELKTINNDLYNNIKILPFSHFVDNAGIFFPKFWKSRGIDESKFLIPYFCEGCKNYHIAPKYEGEEKNCPFCAAQRSCHTPSVMSGLTDIQLNEIYNISNLFALPTSNEGFGLPISEAQSAGRIVLTTDYSTCKELVEDSGAGFTIPCMLYVEYGTLFYKAHLSPYNIAKQINKVYNLKPHVKQELEAKARKYATTVHNYDKLAKDWESYLDEIPVLENINWNVKAQEKNPNPNGALPETSNDVEWLLSLYKNILDTDIFTETNGKPLENQGIQYWLAEISQNRRTKPDIEAYFRQIAVNDLSKKSVDLASILDPTDFKRLLFVMPQSAGDNFLSTAIIQSLKDAYPDFSIYIASKPEFSDIWANNPNIKKWIPFNDAMLQYGWGVDRFEKGLFTAVLTPTILTQLMLPNWHFNGVIENKL